MSIQIKELFPGDNMANLSEKINFNFDQLILAGGGPPGPSGPIGPTGSIGPVGKPGDQWIMDGGSGATGATGSTSKPLQEGDQFLEVDGDVWEWNGTNWINTGVNLKGPQGETGASGSSIDISRWVGDNLSSFGAGWYPQPPGGATPSPATDFIELGRGGTDSLFLGDPEAAWGYGGTGSNSGIQNIPSGSVNAGKLWVIQNGLNAAGNNGIILGAIGATDGNSGASAIADYRNFTQMYIGQNKKLYITHGSNPFMSDPKGIEVISNYGIRLQGESALGDVLEVGTITAATGATRGVYGKGTDIIKFISTDGNVELWSEDEDIKFVIDNDITNSIIGERSATLNTRMVDSPVQKILHINLSPTDKFGYGFTASGTTGHAALQNNAFADGISISLSDNISANFQAGQYKFTPLANYDLPWISIGIGATGVTAYGSSILGATDSTGIEKAPGNEIIITPGYVHITDGHFEIDQILNSGLNPSTGMPLGSIMIDGQIQMNLENTSGNNGPGLIWADSNNRFWMLDGLGSTNGSPSGTTQLGFWSRSVSQQRIFPTNTNDRVTIGPENSSILGSGYMLAINGSPSRSGGIYINDDDPIKIIMQEGNPLAFPTKITILQSPDVPGTGTRTQKLPRSLNNGGTLMSFTNTDGDHTDNWLTYRNISSVTNDLRIESYASQGIWRDHTTNVLNVFDGKQQWTEGTGLWEVEGPPSIINIRQINEQYAFIQFAITIAPDRPLITSTYQDYYGSFGFLSPNKYDVDNVVIGFSSNDLPGHFYSAHHTNTGGSTISAYRDTASFVWYTGNVYNIGRSITENGVPTDYAFPSQNPINKLDKRTTREFGPFDQASYDIHKSTINGDAGYHHPCSWSIYPEPTSGSSNRFRLAVWFDPNNPLWPVISGANHRDTHYCITGSAIIAAGAPGSGGGGSGG